jgi:hypothetical protein
MIAQSATGVKAQFHSGNPATRHATYATWNVFGPPKVSRNVLHRNKVANRNGTHSVGAELRCSGTFVQLKALSLRGFVYDKAALCFFLDPLTNFNSIKLWEVDRKKTEAILLPHKQQRS